MPREVLLVAVVGIVAWLATRAFRAYAIREAILDIPNDRSSHAHPTPRGGGVAIAGATILGLLALWGMASLPARFAIAVAGGGAFLTAINWIDDRHGLSQAVRLVAQTLAAVWALAWLGGLPALRVGSFVLDLGWAGVPLGILGIVWFVNLTNFMDGIDGIAGSNAVATSVLGAGLLFLAGAPTLAWPALAIAAATAGFLPWNWAPAKIFMGDTGSAFLGFFMATLALASENSGGVPLASWAILHGAFIFDATVTLIRRMVRGDRWYAPHREHAYQRLLQAGWTHARVSCIYLGITSILSALALFSVAIPSSLGLMAGLAIAGLAGLYLNVEQLHPMQPADRGERAVTTAFERSTR